MKTYLFHVSGTHCPSCKIMIEDTLLEVDGIQSISVSLKKETVSLEQERDEDPVVLAQRLTQKIAPYGYMLSVEKESPLEQSRTLIWKAVPLGLVFLVVFFLLQKSGILNFGIGGSVSPATGFIIGLIASVSSCLAIVGGLVLSLSAKVSQEGTNISKKLFTLFHIGRIVGFAVLGGVLGLVGKAIGISFVFSAILGIAASVVMIMLGLNLVGVFKKNNITLPGTLFAYFRKIEHKIATPLIVGLGTFFLPCGFTQSMQISALSSGSFISGMSLMLAFALGTFPVLALLSFSSVSFARSKHAPLFFVTAGVIVIGLGLFSLLAGLAGVGIINPLFTI